MGVAIHPVDVSLRTGGLLTGITTSGWRFPTPR